MEVRPGYKQTESGVIPEDWECKQLGEFAAYTNGKAHEQSITDFGKYVVVNSKFISTNGEIRKYSEKSLCEAMRGDVLMVMSDVPNGRAIAKCFLVDYDQTYTVNQRICILRPRQVNGQLLFYKLDRNPYYLAFDDGAKQTNLRKNDVLSCQLGVPKSESEQRAIATALLDVDALLDGLTRLIAKKRDLKQATMQQLLTGQTRLPGFSNEWVESRLRDVIEEIGDGGTPATSNPRNFGGAINWVVIEDIKDEISATALKLTEQGLKSCTAKLWPPDTLIVSTGATIGEVGIARVPLATKQGICGVVVDKSKAIPDYLKYWFRLNKPLLLAKAQGSTIKEIRAPTLVQLELRVPSVTEQDAIVSVLSAMDAELSALEARLIKTRALKQAMMSELLTGKTRLPT